MSGVSVDLATAPPSQADQDLKLAYAGGDDFMSRLQALSTQKAKADASLVALKLGTDAQTALDNATAALAEAESNRTAATTMFAQADTVLKQAHVDAEEERKNGKADADAMRADAQRMVDFATAVKADADADRAAAASERQQLATEREAARRRGEDGERTRMVFERKIAALHAAIDVAQAELVELSGGKPAAAAAVQLAS